MSADSLRLEFDSDAKQFAGDEKDAENLEAAVGYWLGYPVFVEVVQFHPDWDNSQKCGLQYALGHAHHAAVQVLMRTAERLHLDSSALWEEGRICRELFLSPDLHNPEFRGVYDTWPDCLGSARYQLPQGMQDAIQQGEATFMRLTTLVGMSPDDLARIVETVKQNTGGTNATTDNPDQMLTPQRLADRAGIPEADKLARDSLRKTLEKWRRENISKQGTDWVEVADRKPREPGFLYRLGAVEHLLLTARATG